MCEASGYCIIPGSNGDQANLAGSAHGNPLVAACALKGLRSISIDALFEMSINYLKNI